MRKNLAAKTMSFMLAAIIIAGLAPIKTEANNDVTIIPDSGAGSATTDNTGGPHSHTYEWMIAKQATEFEDGKMVQRCTGCGDEREGAAAISAYGNFNEKTIQAIQNAPAESTVEVDAGPWISFTKGVIGALTERSDVMLSVDYKDKGENHSFYIPAGGTGKITDEADYYGFYYLSGVWGLTDSVIDMNDFAIEGIKRPSEPRASEIESIADEPEICPPHVLGPWKYGSDYLVCAYCSYLQSVY